MTPTPAALDLASGCGAVFGAGGLPPNSQHGNSFHSDFPLPRLKQAGRARPRGHRPRDCVRRQAAVIRATNEAIGALNFLSGGEVKIGTGIRPAATFELPEAPAVVQRLHDVIDKVEFEPLGQEASLKAMLRGRGGEYENSDLAQRSLASFNIHALALPESTATAPLVYDLLEGDLEAQQSVKEPERLLR